MAESLAYAEQYFADQADSIAEYWARFGTEPTWDGLRVLDLGCGHGAMSVRIAAAGGDVTGVDLDADRIAFARRHAAAHFPELAGRLRFESVAVEALPGSESFDVVVSKDTFEHVDDVPALLATLAERLRPGGRLYAGFSPLYYSPYGDHGRTGLKVPWLHAVLPSRLVLAGASRHHGTRVGSLGDLGLNGWTGRQFLDAFRACDLEVATLRINQGDQRLLRVLDRARKVRALERFATVSIYAVLRRPE